MNTISPTETARPDRVGDEPADIDRLCNLLKHHNPHRDLTRIYAAFDLAREAHAGTLRRTGDPYITHPIAVAEVVAGLGLDEPSICAALLHDVVEDTDVSIDDIITALGADDVATTVAHLVEGLTKLDGLHFDDPDSHRAGELRRLLVAIAGDPRVLVIKLADRLHNMRTLGALDETARRRIASETMTVFAPLAHRLGMGSIRAELEDLAFFHLQPDEYAAITAAVNERVAGLDDELSDLTGTLETELRGAGIDANVTWRVKHRWGIASKMSRQKCTFEEIYDVVGVRVIVGGVTDCYAAIGIIHARWMPVPGRFRDFVANPRPNGYQSLHTTVWGPAGRPVEVQVRTEEMHQNAEYGVAAHWAYKESARNGEDLETVAWMRRLLEDPPDTPPGEFLASVTDTLSRQEILCLTPRGRAIVLPEGSTPVDFAYAIHTEVGDRAIGARVNGAMVGLDHRLNDGDQVHIIVSGDPNRGPNSDWSTWVRTPRARRLIRRWHTRARREQSAQIGWSRISEAVSRRAQRFGLDQVDTSNLPEQCQPHLHRWGFSDVSTFAAAVGEGRISAESVAARLVSRPEPARPQPRPPVGDNPAILVEGLRGVSTTIAGCCSPQPPAQIVGWVTRGRGVSVHRIGCQEITALATEDPARLVSVDWDRNTELTTATLTVSAFDRPGLLADITGGLRGAGADIRKAHATTDGPLATQRYELVVGGRTALEELTARLWEVDGVVEVDVTET